MMHYWPKGYDRSDRLDHGEWPEYFIKSLYITEDPLVGICLETPHFWKDDDGYHDTSDIEYPTQVSGDPEIDSGGLYNPSFDQYSLAGWCYHGGGGQNRLGNSVDEDGKADLCQFKPSIEHNWSKLNSNLHYSFLRLYATASGVATSTKLSLSWNEQLLSDPTKPITGIQTFPVDFDISTAGKLKANLTGAFSSTHVDVDNFEFITTDKPTIGWLSFNYNPVPLGWYSTLTAHQLLDADGIKSIEVYADTNKNSLPDANEQVYTGSVWGDYKIVSLDSKLFGTGDIQILVRISDMNDVWSDFYSTLLTVGLPEGDKDADGLPDEWEEMFFSSETNALADVDSDGDGCDNITEYIMGTIPTNAESFLKIDINEVVNETNGISSIKISWNAVTNRIYGVWGRDSLSDIYLKISKDLPYPINSHIDPFDDKKPNKFYKVNVHLK